MSSPPSSTLPEVPLLPPTQRAKPATLPQTVPASGVCLGDYLYLTGSTVYEIIAIDDSVPSQRTLTGRELFPNSVTHSLLHLTPVSLPTVLLPCLVISLPSTVSQPSLLSLLSLPPTSLPCLISISLTALPLWSLLSLVSLPSLPLVILARTRPLLRKRIMWRGWRSSYFVVTTSGE